MSEFHEDFQNAIRLMREQIEVLQKEFGHVYSGKALIANKVSYPNNPEATAETRQRVKALIEGSLLVYLFAMWESHMPDDVADWLTRDEGEQLNAYRHVRHSVAHGYRGKRAKKCREEFESLMPFDGIQWEQEADTIDISNASVALRCHYHMVELCKRIAVRLDSGKKPTER